MFQERNIQNPNITKLLKLQEKDNQNSGIIELSFISGNGAFYPYKNFFALKNLKF